MSDDTTTEQDTSAEDAAALQTVATHLAAPKVRTPSAGRIVTYHSEDYGDVPAMILRVNDDGSVLLRCFAEGLMPSATKDFELRSVSQSPDVCGWSFNT